MASEEHHVYPGPLGRNPRYDRADALRRAGYGLLNLASDLERLRSDAPADDMEREVQRIVERLSAS